MSEALLFFTVSSLLIISVATLVVAVRALSSARRYVELAERRMEHVREGRARLLEFLQEEHQRLKEELQRERAQRAESRQEVYSTLLEGSSPLLEGSLEAPLEEGMFTQERTSPVEQAPEARRTPPPEHPRRATDAGSRKASGEDKKSDFVVWHPHPDDDVSPGKASASRDGARSVVPTKMFRKHYERYLENYEGYVKLLGSIYQMRDEGQLPPGSPAEREWVERLRRVNDGIARTTARLDILEQSNPELATDECISQRASIAHAHQELERKT